LIEVNQSARLGESGFSSTLYQKINSTIRGHAISPKNQASGSRRMLRLPDPVVDSAPHCAIAQ
jgi:hypothetical protein